MSEFKREERYTVIKYSQLTDKQIGFLKDCIFGEGIPTVECVVVESDWSIYEDVWKMVEELSTTKYKEVWGSNLMVGQSILFNEHVHTLLECVNEGETHSGSDFYDWLTQGGATIHILGSSKIKILESK
jgi:hypothetical protein